MNLAILAFTVGLAVTVALGPAVIPALRRLRVGQQIRSDGPLRHLAKAGTPTMGGVIFLAGTALATILLAPRSLPLAVLAVSLGYGVLGFADDYIKVVLRRSLGLRARWKLLGQVGLAAAMVGYAAFHGRGTSLAIPYIDRTLDLGVLYYLFGMLVIVGFANAVNLTDGLDGLAAGASAISFLAYAAALARTAPDLATFAGAFAGGAAGFLVYNRHPARVFMGDTGSLALGGGLASLAVASGTELPLLFIGGLFVVETLSVIIQVISFQAFRRRVFRMSPLHHHFELSGWSEGAVVSRFWFVQAVLALAGLVGAASVLH